MRPTLIKIRERGLKLGLVSDAPRLKAWLRLTGIGLADFFDVVVTVDDVKGKMKPNPMGFNIVMKKFNCSKETAENKLKLADGFIAKIKSP